MNFLGNRMNIQGTRAELPALDNKFLNNTSNQSSLDGKKEQKKMMVAKREEKDLKKSLWHPGSL